MNTNSETLNKKKAILNFISESNDSVLISKVKEIIDLFNSNREDEIDIPEWQKKMVRERIKNSKREDMIPLDELEKRLKF